jgi:mono/diheme cytochrome c family protein
MLVCCALMTYHSASLWVLRLAAVTAVVATIGCSGGDNKSGPADASLDAPSSFSTNVYGPILTANCVGCHGPTLDGAPGPGVAYGHLDMTSATVAYGNLVGGGGGVLAGGSKCAALGMDSGLKRVVPGDPINSLFYNKVASNDGDGGDLALPDGGSMVFCGHSMPLGSPGLGAGNLSTIRDWIQQGAQP